MKKKYKIHFTLSWSAVAFLALILLACKSCTPAHAADTNLVAPPGTGGTVPQTIIVSNTPLAEAPIIPPPPKVYQQPNNWPARIHSNLTVNTGPTPAQIFWRHYYATNKPAVKP